MYTVSLPVSPPPVAQLQDASKQRFVVVELVIPGHGTNHRVVAGEAPGPLNGHVHALTVPHHGDGHLLDEMTQEGLTVGPRGLRRMPELGDVRGQLADPLVIGVRQSRGLFLAESASESMGSKSLWG